MERAKRLRHVLSCVRGRGAGAAPATIPPHIVERPQFGPGEHQVGGMDTVRPEIGGAAFSDEEARAVALAMPNRGPLRFVDGKVDPQIVDDFNRFGFYVLTGVLDRDGEFAQLKSEVDAVIAHADAACEAMPDIGDGGSRQGAIVPQPAAMPREGVAWRHFREGWQPGMGMSAAAPLATDANPSGRNPSAMDQPDVPTGLEHRRVLRSIMSWGRLSEAAFALQGHPGLLSLVEAILGEAFTVFGGVHSELLIKAAHLGPSVAWHQVRYPFLTGAPPFLAERGRASCAQDGQTHVAGNRGADLHRHPHGQRSCSSLCLFAFLSIVPKFCIGFNLFCNLDETTPETSLWVVPHSHNWGHLDIPSLVSEHGERLPTALPVLTKPGDIAFSSRNMLHGSFANTGPRRATLIWGYLPHDPALAKFSEDELGLASEQIQLAANWHRHLHGGGGAGGGGGPSHFVHKSARGGTAWKGWAHATEVLDRQPAMRPF